MEPRPRPSYVRNSLAIAVLAMLGQWAGIAAAATEGGQPLQLDILINGEKTGLLGSFVQLPNGNIAARRSELVEAGVKAPGPGQPDDLVVLNDLLGDKFKYEEPSQSISFELTDNQRVARTFDAMLSSPQIPVSTSWGSVLNYTVFGSETSGLNPRQATFSGASASLEARTFTPYGAFAQSQVFVTAFADLTNRQNYGIYAGISIPLGESASMSSGATTSKSGTSFTTDASRPLASQPGSYGWRVRDSEGAVADRSAAGSYRSSVATVQAGVEQSLGNVIRGTAQVDGAVATMGSGVFVTNRIDDSFAVVDTGTPGVPVLYENRPAGETNSSGKLLIPNLRAYGSNKISIDPKGLGVNDEIETTEEVVAPANRSGVLVSFKTTTNVQEAVVILVGADGKPLAVGSKGKLDGGTADFVVGYDGRAFVKDLKGANAVTVSLEKGECHASFDYTAASDHQVMIGPVSCL